MPPDDPLDGGQADAVSGKFLLAVQSLEGCEQFVRIFHAEAGPIVADEKSHGAIGLRGGTEFNDGALPLQRVFPCIGQKVFDHDLQQTGISPGFEIRWHGEFHLMAGVAGAKAGNNISREDVQIYLHPIHLHARKSRKAEQVVDQSSHPGNLKIDLPKKTLGVLARARWQFLPQKLGKAANPAQRRAQIMGNGVRKCLQVLVGGLTRCSSSL